MSVPADELKGFNFPVIAEKDKSDPEITILHYYPTIETDEYGVNSTQIVRSEAGDLEVTMEPETNSKYSNGRHTYLSSCSTLYSNQRGGLMQGITLRGVFGIDSQDFNTRFMQHATGENKAVLDNLSNLQLGDENAILLGSDVGLSLNTKQPKIPYKAFDMADVETAEPNFRFKFAKDKSGNLAIEVSANKGVQESEDKNWKPGQQNRFNPIAEPLPFTENGGSVDVSRLFLGEGREINLTVSSRQISSPSGESKPRNIVRIEFAETFHRADGATIVTKSYEVPARIKNQTAEELLSDAYDFSNPDKLKDDLPIKMDIKVTNY